MHGLDMHPFPGNAVHNPLRHLFGAVPHGVVYDKRLLFRDLKTPFLVGFSNPGWIFPPDNAMVRTYNLQLEVKVCNRLNQLINFCGIKKQDIGKVFFSMLHDGIIELIIALLRAGIMLAESIA